MVMSSVIGGAMLPHAPQFFTMPDTEDRGTVDRVRETAAEIGARLKALAPDLWIIFANDHAEQFFPPETPPAPHYPSIKPELVELTVALQSLAHDEASRAAFLADAAGYANRFKLTSAQRAALVTLDIRAIVAMGAHPLVPFLANMQIERQRRG